MTRYLVDEKREYDELQRRHAASKAREDARNILLQAGFAELPFGYQGNRQVNPVSKALIHLELGRLWGQALSGLSQGDAVVFQYPLYHQTLLFSRVLRALGRRGVTTVLLVHDAQSIRDAHTAATKHAGNARMLAEEKSSLRAASRVIVHNEAMASQLAEDLAIPQNRLVPLGIFDYLQPEGPAYASTDASGPVVVAGNLVPEKAGYAYRLPRNVDFRLYGPAYEPQASAPNVAYAGSFPPNELPAQLAGSFGLVWDGPQASTCTGTYGSYLRVNNPHKASLYLAAGLPVVIWSQAALAGFVQREGVGIAVPSLDCLRDALDAVSPQDYQRMCEAARALSARLRQGHYLRAAVQEALS